LNVKQIQPMKGAEDQRDRRFEEAVAAFGPALERLARAYEADPEGCRDLVQEILISLWTSLKALTTGVPCGPGSTAWPTTRQPRM